MKTSESIVKISAALAKAQAHIGGAEKSSVNPFHKSKYATLADVIAACKEALCQQGVSVLQLVSNNEAGAFTMTTTLLHESGENISTTMVLPIPVQKANDVQAMGSAVTYCRRYQLQALLNIPAVDDDGEFARKAFSDEKPEEKAKESELKAKKNWRSLVITGIKNPEFKGRKLGDLTKEQIDKLISMIEEHPDTLSVSPTVKAIHEAALAAFDELLESDDAQSEAAK